MFCVHMYIRSSVRNTAIGMQLPHVHMMCTHLSHQA
jgi:hypothetical protein